MPQLRAVRRMAMAAATAITLLTVAWPAVTPDPSDGLPVSNYPMFARPRDRVGSFPLVVLRDRDGRERELSVREISGTDQPMQAAMTISQAVLGGTADTLCVEIAATITDPGEIAIVTATYDSVAWFEGDRTPRAWRVHASCRTDAVP